MYKKKKSRENRKKHDNEAFGNDWEEQILAEVKEYFLHVPYNIPTHFLSVPRQDFKVEKDVLFYSGEGFKLNFDMYTPTRPSSELPRKGSIIF
ncbi:MAG: hypothetical protein ACTSUN_00910 [Promethearchaeota archaeon]